MEKLFGNYFLGKSHFSYMNVFGINFAIISGWSVFYLADLSMITITTNFSNV